MNNYKRIKIITYIDGSMDSDEKLLFEKELGTNEELRKKVLEMKSFLGETKNVAIPSLNESYFINIIPEFYNRRSFNKKFHIPLLTYSLSGIAAAIIILFILFNPFKTSENSESRELSVNLTEKEMDETLNQYEDPYSYNELINSATSETELIVNNMVKDELDLSYDSIDKTIAEKYINTDDLLDSISENEADKLYSQLINEDIINGARQ